MYKEIIEELKKSKKDFLEYKSSDKIIRFYFSDKEYEANSDIPPNCVLSCIHNKDYDLFILTLDRIKFFNKDSEERFKKLKEASEPLIKYLNDNYHPHVTAIVTNNKCEIVEGLITHVTDEFILD